MTVYGYDPERIESLDRRTRTAITALAAIDSDDPAAADATRAVARLRATLGDGWMPLIGAIRTSAAMTSWREAHLTDPTWRDRTSSAPPALGWMAAPVATWIATNGLHDLTDHEVVERLGHAIAQFRATVAGGGDTQSGEQRLAAIAEEARRRARHDPQRFAVVLTKRLDDGAVAILGAIDALARTSARDPRRHGTPPAALDLVELLAPLSGQPAVADLLRWHVRNSTSLPPLIAATSRVWDGDVLAGLTTGLIDAIVTRDHVAATITPIELAGNVTALTRALVDDPVAALSVLCDGQALPYLVTNRYLDPSAVEALLTAALVQAPAAVPSRMSDGIGVLTGVVGVTASSELNDGAKRGVAASMVTFFPLLAPQLDVRLPVVVAYGAGAAETAELGSYCDVQRLLGQLLTDDAAQLVLGAMTERYRAVATAGLAATITARPYDDAGEHRARIAAALADVSAVTALVLRSRAARTSLQAYGHGLVVGRAKDVVEWAATIGSIAAPSSNTLLTPAIPIASLVVTEALDLLDPSRLRDLGIDAAAAIGFTATLLALATRAPHVRAALGLGAVPADTWRRLDDLLDELGTTDHHHRRLAIHSTLVAIAAGDPDLDLFVTGAEVLGGEAALGGPQSPAACE